MVPSCSSPIFIFFYFSFLLICKHIQCFFSMGRVSIKTQITRKSIGKIDNQMSSGIELEIVAIHQPDYYTPFFFPRSMWTRIWAQNAIPHQTSARMNHLKVYMIIISCWDCTLHFNVFITTHMGALVILWKGGTMFEQLGGIKMTVWQPFIPYWMAKSMEPFPRNLKVWRESILGHLFLKWAKNYICYKEEYWHWFHE